MTSGAHASSVRQTATKPASQSRSIFGATVSRSCEPRWMWSPATSIPRLRASATAAIACSGVSGGLEPAQRRNLGPRPPHGGGPLHRHVRERLRAVCDERGRRSLAVGTDARAERLLAVHDERSAELFREGAHTDAADRELA